MRCSFCVCVVFSAKDFASSKFWTVIATYFSNSDNLSTVLVRASFWFWVCSFSNLVYRVNLSIALSLAIWVAWTLAISTTISLRSTVDFFLNSSNAFIWAFSWSISNLTYDYNRLSASSFEIWEASFLAILTASSLKISDALTKASLISYF